MRYEDPMACRDDVMPTDILGTDILGTELMGHPQLAVSHSKRAYAESFLPSAHFAACNCDGQ